MTDIDGDLFDDNAGHECLDPSGENGPNPGVFGIDVNADEMIDAECGAIDSDGDGIPDTTYVAVDVDSDGVPDIGALEVDADQDGEADVRVIFGDVDGDEVPDIALDENADGTLDLFAFGDEARAIWGDLATASADATITPQTNQDSLPDSTPLSSEDCYAALASTYADLNYDGYEAYYELHGTPAEDLALWDEQDAPFSCAIATTSMMYRSFGLDFGEDVLTAFFETVEIYDPSSGTDLQFIDDAINAFSQTQGVDAHAVMVQAQSVDDFAGLLDAGFKPMVAIDPYELDLDAAERQLNDMGLLPSAGHAVQLTGLERTPEGVFAIVNDPDRGAGYRVPFERFWDAANDYSNSCVVMGDTAMFAACSSSAGDSTAPAFLGSKALTTVDPVSQRVYQGDSLFPLC